MLYNIHGLKAVRVKYISNGKSKSVMVGTAGLRQAQAPHWRG